MPATVLTPGEVKCSSQDGRLNCWYDLALALPLTRILRLSSVPVGVPISGFKHQYMSRIAIWALTVQLQLTCSAFPRWKLSKAENGSHSHRWRYVP